MRIVKHFLRTYLRQRRKLLSSYQQMHYAQKITQHVLQKSYYLQARHVALYQANAGEVSTQYLLKQTLAHHKNCYLPVLTGTDMHFIKVDSTTCFTPNRYGILEPIYDAQQIISPQVLELVLLPLVAFDRQGHRLGMGKGYYDRAFSFTKQTGPRPRLVGLAYDFQRVNAVPHSNLDVLLDEIITDKACYEVN